MAKKEEVAGLPDPDRHQNVEMESVVVAASDAVRPVQRWFVLYRVWYRKSAATTHHTISASNRIGLTGKSVKLKCSEFST